MWSERESGKVLIYRGMGRRGEKGKEKRNVTSGMMLAVVELGGAESNTGGVDVADGDGACDAVDGFDDALQDGCLLWHEGCDGIA